MSFEQLVDELKKLNRVDKLRVMNLLVSELAAEEGAWFGANTPFEIITPLGNELAAAVLYDFLQSSDPEVEI
jgi:hypothetical protein